MSSRPRKQTRKPAFSCSQLPVSFTLQHSPGLPSPGVFRLRNNSSAKPFCFQFLRLDYRGLDFGEQWINLVPSRQQGAFCDIGKPATVHRAKRLQGSFDHGHGHNRPWSRGFATPGSSGNSGCRKGKSTATIRFSSVHVLVRAAWIPPSGPASRIHIFDYVPKAANFASLPTTMGFARHGLCQLQSWSSSVLPAQLQKGLILPHPGTLAAGQDESGHRVHAVIIHVQVHCCLGSCKAYFRATPHGSGDPLVVSGLRESQESGVYQPNPGPYFHYPKVT